VPCGEDEFVKAVVNEGLSDIIEHVLVGGGTKSDRPGPDTWGMQVLGFNMKKADIIKKGLDLKAPFEKTWSCYIGNEKACGRCDSCLLRLKGFKETGAQDPIEYAQLPDWYKN
jgi:hypothetical protein